MDNRPIGIFDSGLGGLTAVVELEKLCPNEDLIYFGDTGRMPYGTRSNHTILRYAREDMGFLLKHDVKAVLVACGTVSAVALDIIKDDYPIPIIGVVGPTALMAAKATLNRRVGVIATTASINSNAYGRALSAVSPEIEVFSNACPLLATLVENGRIHKGDVVIETVVREYLEPLQREGVDTLILGCTHYPLLTEVISDIFGGAITLINSGKAAAEYLSSLLAEFGMTSAPGRAGSAAYYVSDNSPGFARLGELLMGKRIEGKVSQVRLEE